MRANFLFFVFFVVLLNTHEVFSETLPLKQVKETYSLPPKKDQNHPQVSLDSLYQEAKKSNLDLQILKEKAYQADLLRTKAWSAFQPSLTFQGIYRFNDPVVKLDPTASIKGLLDSLPDFLKTQIQDGMGNSEPIVITPQHQLMATGTLQWGLNFAAIPLIQASYLTSKQVGQTVLQMKREILFGVAKSYYGTLLAEGMVNIARQSWKNAVDHFKISKARYQAGVVPELNITRAKVDVIKAYKTVIESENALAQLKSSMALLLNKERMKFQPIRPASPPLPKGSKKDWLLIAKKSRPELKATLLALQTSEKNLSSAWLEWLPTLGVQGNFNWQNNAGFAGQEVTWNVSVVASFTLYNRGTRITKIQEANSQKRQATLEHKKQIRTVENEVRNAIRDLENAQQTLTVSKQQLELSEKTYLLTQERYKTGVATPVEVSDAMTLLTSARIGLLREQLNLDLSVLNLKRVMHQFLP